MTDAQVAGRDLIGRLKRAPWTYSNIGEALELLLHEAAAALAAAQAGAPGATPEEMLPLPGFKPFPPMLPAWMQNTDASFVTVAPKPTEPAGTLAARILRCLKWHYGAEASDKDGAAEQMIAELIAAEQLALLQRGG